MSTLLADPLPPRPATVTLDEFMAHPDFKDYELISGTLQPRKEMGAYANAVAAQVIIELGLFARRAGGHVLTSETVYRCFDDLGTGRKPDVSFVAKGRFLNESIPDGFVTVPPDLAVEVVSTHDLASAVQEKLEQYLAAGFPQVWVIYPTTRTLHVYRPNQPSFMVLHVTDTLMGAGALAGFSCPLASFFPTPASSPL